MDYPTPPNQQAYYEQVWHLVRQIPHATVATYGQIADMILPPAQFPPDDYKTYAPRWVGAAMAACPADVPWQRVINSQGKISGRPGDTKQRQLLEEEGVLFTKDKINLAVYQWRGPGQEQPPRQARLL